MKKQVKIMAKATVCITAVVSIVTASLGTSAFSETSNRQSNRINGISCDPDILASAEISITPENLSEEDREFYSMLEAAIAEKEQNFENRALRRDNLPALVDIGVTWQRQNNLYYCGPATASMILGDFMIMPTQTTIAGNDYLRTNSVDGTPWYSGDGSQSTLTLYYFNMPYGLNMWQYDQLGRMIFPYTYCHGESDKTVYIQKIMSTLADGYAVPLHGSSENKSIESEYLSLHKKGHWLVIDGYSIDTYGTHFYIVDPASGLEKTYENLPQTYRVSLSDLKEYIDYGIVW